MFAGKRYDWLNLFPGDQREIFARFRQRRQSGFSCREQESRFFIKMPLTFFIDTDQDDFVFIRVDRVDDILRRLQGDFMLCGTTAK